MAMLYKSGLILNKYDVLLEGCSLMNNYWLASGTMLGLYREGDFIKDDTDIDIDTLDLVDLDKFYKSGFELFRTFDKYQTALIKNDVIFDIWRSFPEGDILYCYSDFGRMEQPKSLFKKLGKIEFKGNQFNVPEDIESYLEMRYGDWTTPKKGAWNTLANHIKD